MNVNDAFPSKTLKASDLGNNLVTVRISHVEVEAMGRGKDAETKPVVYFEGKSKGLVLNKTNAKRIVEITGSPDTDHWKGHAITLYATETEFQGETVDCIRVKAPTAGRPNAGRPAPPPPPPPPVEQTQDDFQISDDDVPF